MTPIDKGRFCASCQKNVIDFTRASDREIAQTLKQGGKLCGKFRADQLERDLIIPKEKGSFWAAASAAVISFLTLGGNEAIAQEPMSTEKTPTQNNDTTGTTIRVEIIKLKGYIEDQTGRVPGASIRNKMTGEFIQSDTDGNYSIEAKEGDIIEYSFVGYKTVSLIASKNYPANIKLDAGHEVMGDIVLDKCRPGTEIIRRKH